MVYLIVVYDMVADRTGKLRRPLRRYLTHTQQSVFEGRVTAGQADDVEAIVTDRIDPGRDESGIVYRLSSDAVIDRTSAGDDPTDGEQFF